MSESAIKFSDEVAEAPGHVAFGVRFVVLILMEINM